MSTLRNQLLHEVTQLDTKGLMALQSMMVTLKEAAVPVAAQKRGVAAAHCREVLGNVKGDLSETIMQFPLNNCAQSANVCAIVEGEIA